jgi:hypothetical protein
MNVRNLFLMSIIICVMPSVCDTPEMSLTKEGQQKVKQLIEIITLLPKEQLEIIKFLFSKHIDYKLLQLGKMRIGRSRSEYENEINRVYEAFKSRYLEECEKVVNSLKIRSIDDRTKIIEKATRMDSAFESDVMYIIVADFEKFVRFSYSEEMITESDILILKREIVIYSFALECLSNN